MKGTLSLDGKGNDDFTLDLSTIHTLMIILITIITNPETLSPLETY